MNDIIAKVSPFLTQNTRRPVVQRCFPRTGGETKRSPGDRTAADLTLSDRLSAPHQNVSYLILDAQRKVFPLPSHGRTPAAQPRLLSPVHAPGKDTAQVRTRTHKKNSPKCATREPRVRRTACARLRAAATRRARDRVAYQCASMQPETGASH